MFERVTYDNAGHTAGGVAVPLQLVGHSSENTGRKSHVKDAVLFLLALLDLLEVLVEVDKGLVLVVLARDVCTQLAEAL